MEAHFTEELVAIALPRGKPVAHFLAAAVDKGVHAHLLQDSIACQTIGLAAGKQNATVGEEPTTVGEFAPPPGSIIPALRWMWGRTELALGAATALGTAAGTAAGTRLLKREDMRLAFNYWL